MRCLVPSLWNSGLHTLPPQPSIYRGEGQAQRRSGTCCGPPAVSCGESGVSLSTLNFRRAGTRTLALLGELGNLGLSFPISKVGADRTGSRGVEDSAQGDGRQQHLALCGGRCGGGGTRNGLCASVCTLCSCWQQCVPLVDLLSLNNMEHVGYFFSHC